MMCERVAPYLTAHAAGELPPHTEAWVRSHVAECASCAISLARLGAMTTALRAVAPGLVAPPPDFAAAVAARIRERETHARRRMLPIPPLPPHELARVVQENREAILNGAATAAMAAGAAWLAWRALRSLKRPMRGPRPGPAQA